MFKYLIILVLFLQFSTNIYAKQFDLKPSDLFHITGYENGELVTPIVNLWSKPGGLVSGAKVIGKLSGDGRADQGLKGQGSVVKLLEIKKVNGRIFLKIKTIVNSQVGWITDSFVGRKFDKSKCKKFFKDPKHIANCLSDE